MTTRIVLLVILVLFTVTAGCSNVIRSGLVNSNTIFLDPSTNRTVYLQLRNVSENQQVNLAAIGSKLSAKGYQLVTVPEQANYWIQTKVVYCHQAGQGVRPESLAQSGFGNGISTGGTSSPAGGGDMSGTLSGMNMNAMMRMAMAGQGGFGMSQPQEEGVTYLCATDVLITDRRMGKALAQPLEKPAQAGGSPKLQRMRMVGHVLQKSLDISEATPIIQEKLSTGIAGLF